jgi:uncharacterized protein YbaR (Trm112 family)
MKPELLDILACPKDGFFPLNLLIFEENNEIVSGILVCQKCLHWYPIREKIPEMFPDKLRDKESELTFLRKWKSRVPREVLKAGKPFNLKTRTQHLPVKKR